MRKNIFIKTVALLCVCLTLFTCVACNKGKNNNQNLQKPILQKQTIADTDIFLVENGTSNYKIVISENASTPENYIATELQRYIKYSSGCTLPIIKDNEQILDDYIISVGRNVKLTQSGISVDFSEVGRDGYKIIRKGNSVYICGGKDTGTSFGVYEFLSWQVGYECYAYDEIYYDKKPSIKLKDFNYIDVPSFPERHMDGTMRVSEKHTAFRHRFVDEFGTHVEYSNLGSNTWIGHSGHSLTHYRVAIEKNKYDWFNDCFFNNEQPCLTNENLINGFAEWLISEAIKKPDGYIIGLGHEDAHLAWCSCTNCRMEVAEYTGSGYFVRFANKIISIIENWRETNCPEREFIYSMFAYSLTTTAPVIENANGKYEVVDESCRPHKKLYIRLAPSGACRAHDMEDLNCTMNLSSDKAIQGWASLTNNLMVWIYSADYGKYLPFYNNFQTIQSHLQYFNKLGCRNIFVEYNSGSNLTSFDYLRSYLFGKLTWNVNRNVDELVDNFFTNYYKDVEPQMRELFDLYMSHNAMLDVTSGYNNHSNGITLEDRYNKNIVDKAMAILDDALKTCDKIEDEVLASTLRYRVRMEQICIRYVKLELYEALNYDMDEYNDYLNAFANDVIELGVLRVSEAVSMADYLKNLMK